MNIIDPHKVSSNYIIASDNFFAQVKSKLYLVYKKDINSFSNLTQMPQSFSDITLSNYEVYLALLRKTMQPINPRAFEYIETTLIQMKTFSLKQCLIFHLLMLYSPLSTFPLPNEQFTPFSSNLQMIASIVERNIYGADFSKMFNDEGFDTHCMIEILCVSIGAYLQMFIRETIYSSSIGNAIQLERDLTDLAIVYHLIKYLNVIVWTINDINDLLRCRDYLRNEVKFDYTLFNITKSKWFIDYYSIYTYVLFLIKKYSFYPSMTTFSPHLDMRAMDQFSKGLFCIMEANVLLYYQTYKREFKAKLMTHESFETFVMYSLYKVEHYTWIRYLREDYFLDCQACYPSFHNFNSKFLMNKLLNLFSNKLITVIDSINKAKDDNQIELEDINISLLKEYVQSMKAYLTCHLISSFNNDNVYDASNRNQWILMYFDVFALSNSLLSFVHSVGQYNKSINGLFPIAKDSLITELFNCMANSLNQKVFLVFPMKLYVYKLKMLKNTLIVFDYFINQCNSCFKPGVVLTQIKALPVFCMLIRTLIEVSNQQSMILFYFGNRILKAITNEAYHNTLRIYRVTRFPFDFYDVIEEDKENKAVFASTPIVHKQKNQFDISSLSTENKENISMIANRRTLIIENPQMTIESKAFLLQTHPQSQFQPKASIFDVTKIKDSYDIANLKNAFNDEIVWNQKEGRVHLITTSVDPVILIQPDTFDNTNINLNDNGNDNDKSENQKDKKTIPHSNSILSHMQIDFNERESIINYIYSQMYQDNITNTESHNYSNTTKYYDCENNTNYFDFLDKLDILLA